MLLYCKIDCVITPGSILGPLSFLLYVNDTNQAVDCNLFGENKSKCMLFGTKHILNKVGSRDIRYGKICNKHYRTVTYFGCSVNESISGESMALKVIHKINSRLRFLYRKSRFLSLSLHRLLHNSEIQPHFDYFFAAWYSNLNKSLKSKLKALQNKRIKFCLNLGNGAHRGRNEFKEINWLPVNNHFAQFICSVSFKFFNNLSPIYMNDVFKPAVQTRSTRINLC